MGKNLYEKVFEKHSVAVLPSGQHQLFIGTHLIHEVTSPQAFAMIREGNLNVPYPNRTFATVDHIIPTEIEARKRPLQDVLAEEMLQHIEKNTKDYGIRFFSPENGEQGVVHVVGPEQGLTHPGMTIACGDSHTSTHGAFGAIAFGIGTSQVADVLATQTLAMHKLKVRRINFTGSLKPGVYAKDAALAYINIDTLLEKLIPELDGSLTPDTTKIAAGAGLDAARKGTRDLLPSDAPTLSAPDGAPPPGRPQRKPSTKVRATADTIFFVVRAVQNFLEGEIGNLIWETLRCTSVFFEADHQ